MHVIYICSSNIIFKSCTDFSSFQSFLPAQDVPGTSPECPLEVVMSRTYREPLEDSHGTNTKTDDLMEKLFLRSNSPCIIYLFLFLQKEQIFKSSKRGRPWDIYRIQFWDVPGSRWWNVLGTLAGRRSEIIFKIRPTKILKLLWQVTHNFIVNGTGEKCSKQYSG